jgi:uncharacterized protein (DUF1778 family)
MAKEKAINFRVSARLAELISIAAKEESRTVSNYCSLILERHLNERFKDRVQTGLLAENGQPPASE